MQGLWIGAVGSGVREEEEKTERRKRKEEKEKDDQVVPIIKVPRRAQPDAFSHTKMKHKKHTKASHTQKNT